MDKTLLASLIIVTGVAAHSLGPWGIHVGVWQPHHGGRHSHHAISLQPNCMIKGYNLNLTRISQVEPGFDHKIPNLHRCAANSGIRYNLTRHKAK